MAFRNLTNSNSASFLSNPFASENQSIDSQRHRSPSDTYASSEDSEVHRSYDPLVNLSPNVSVPVIDYPDGPAGTVSGLGAIPGLQTTNGLNGTTNPSASASTNFGLDRYPRSTRASLTSSPSSGSLLSSGSANSASAGSANSANSGNSAGSTNSGNPFVIDGDFSPFGGYPVSSFPLLLNEKEADDYLHNPDPLIDSKSDKHRFSLREMDRKGIATALGFLFLIVGILVLFIVLPALTYSGVASHGEPVSYEVLSSYVYPQLSAIRTSLVDPDTPKDALTHTAKDGSEWELVFSDEFNAEGRTFYDGDDQFWTCPDFHYDATKDLEWYSPDAASTANGTLNIRLDAYKNHNLFYRSAMLQSWNKLCFQQGYLEVSAQLANYGNVSGLWPGIWTLGNLARPGYLATTEGVWPYSYNECDAGITPNQSSPDGISYLPGQRLSSCTCPGEDHPNAGVGRGAPEIDALEGSIDTTLGTGVASQSLQVAPFDIWYMPDYEFIELHNTSTTTMNTYAGGPFQQAVSGVSTLNPEWYEFVYSGKATYQTYGFEYLYGTDGYIRWFVGQDPTFTLYANALHPNGNIGWRTISEEPMSIVMNMGISNNWAYINWAGLSFPSTMRVDYVRLYQPKGSVSLTCDPSGHPTSDYIEQHKNAYENMNLTSWKMAGYEFPKNKLTGC